MKVFVIILALFIAASVTILPWYLAPDDLKNCQDRPSEDIACHRVDAIVAVSGGDTNARTDEAIKLYHAGWSDTLIFSGAAADMSGPSNAEAMRLRAIDSGVPQSDILIEEFSRTTAENAVNTAEFIQRRGISRVILTTSSYHQRRASLEFKASVGEGVAIINHPVPHDKQWSQFWWLRPDSLFLAYSELVKIIIFYVKGVPTI